MTIEFPIHEWRAFLEPFLTALHAQRPCRPRIRMTRTAYAEGIAALAGHDSECAVLLLGPRGHPAVTHIVADTTGEGLPLLSQISAQRLNDLLEQFAPFGLDGKGFWHSHPAGCHRLSEHDLVFVRQQFAHPKNTIPELLMPIMSGGLVFPYIVRRDSPHEAIAAELVLF